MARIFVDTLADVVNGADGVTSLREAVALAETTAGRDQIFFTQGGTLSFTLGDIEISSGISISGDVTGNGVADVVLDGTSNGARAFEVRQGGVLALENLTLQNFVEAGNLGGAVRIRVGGELSVEETAFLNNRSIEGGAIGNQGILSIRDSDFTGNEATSTGGGGAVASRGSVLEVVGSVFSQNTSSVAGGAIIGSGSNQTTVVNSAFLGNDAGNGGAIAQFGGTLDLIGSTLAGNIATEGGGVSALSSGADRGDVSIAFSTLTDNTADEGAGILVAESDLDLANSILTGNRTGGGVEDNLDGDGTSGYNAAVLGTVAQSLFGGAGAYGFGTATGASYGVSAGDIFEQTNASNGGIGGGSTLPLTQGASTAALLQSDGALPADTLDVDGDGDRDEPLPLDGAGRARVSDGTAEIGAVEARPGILVVTTTQDSSVAAAAELTLR
ncbi:MAG: hypothetical protein AAF568_02170, partial [Pseudomonadota bacterium]